MKWVVTSLLLCGAPVTFLCVIMAAVIGLLVQPWAPWWMSGGSSQVFQMPAGGFSPNAGPIDLNSPTGIVNTGAIPAPQWAVMQSTAAVSTCGVRAEDLAAIASIESRFGTNMSTNALGFFGYGQFNNSSWAAYGNGGNPYDFNDALPAIERALCSRGYGLNRTKALNSYGGCVSDPCLQVGAFTGTYAQYVDYVLTGLVSPAAISDRSAQVLQNAQKWVDAHVPYLLGGCTTRGVDCSCLVQNVYAVVGVSLPRTADTQFAATARVSGSQVQAGDLVFFANTYMPGISHVGIVLDPVRQLMINAPDTGQPVQVMGYGSGYWAAHVAGFGRVRS